jgi:hypothetical protein
MIFASATLTAAGTPQSVAAATAPTMPTMTVRGITYPAGSATQRARSMTVQADPANTGTNIYIGGRAMNKATRANVGLVLAKTAAPVYLGDGEGFALDDIYFDGDTTGDKLLLTLIG